GHRRSTLSGTGAVAEVDFFVAAEGEDGGDAIARVEIELFERADVPVRVDESGDDGLAGEIDAFRAGGGREIGSHGDDASIADEDRAVGKALARAIDEAHAREGSDLGEGEGRGEKKSGEYTHSVDYRARHRIRSRGLSRRSSSLSAAWRARRLELMRCWS